MYPKVGEDGRVRSRGVMIAVGINRDDYREILGMMVPEMCIRDRYVGA